MKVKLAALDLDGTTLRSDHSLSGANKEALEKAIDTGSEVVVATGRTITSVPEYIKDIKGLRYIITSNGAHIYDNVNKQFIYSQCLDEDAAAAVIETVKDRGFMVEVCCRGRAYTDSYFYNMALEGKLSFRHQQYIVDTRIPVDGYVDFVYDNIREIENISVSFEDLSVKEDLYRELEKIPGTSVTSSFDHNVEVGGSGVSKGRALSYLCEMLDIRAEEAMAVGDSGNDAALLKACGLGIAVENATAELKAIADDITCDNEHDGVARAIEKYITGKY